MRPSFGKKGTPPTPGEPVSRLGKMLSQELDEETSFGDLPQLLMSIGKVCLALMGLALLLAVGLRIVGSFREARQISEAQNLVREHMKDPASVMFKQTYFSRGQFFCGFINARNGFGGYTGFSRFIYRVDNGAFAIAADKDDEDPTNLRRDFNEKWTELCL